MNATFRNPPHLNLLQKLAKGSLQQNQNLTRSVRLWVLLRWLYDDPGYTALADTFTYADWRAAFFSTTYKDEKQQEILTCQNPNCASNKTAKQWLSHFNVPLDEWQTSLVTQIPIARSQLDKVLQERLFAQVRKSLQSDFDLLVDRHYLQKLTIQSGRSKKYSRVEFLPTFDAIENFHANNFWTLKEQAYIAETLDMISYIDPSLLPLAEQIAEQISQQRRVILYPDYLIPECTPQQDRVDQIQSELQDIWNSEQVSPILITYRSAHQHNKITECVIYPVCIYFMERAKYLCAYGSTPKAEINWHNYRLDRVISKRLIKLDWSDPRIPQLLREKYEDRELPTLETVKQKLQEAWGYDFYKNKGLMVLRFERDFHDFYIKGTSLHETFTAIDYHQTVKTIEQNSLSPENRKRVLEILELRPSTDAYYKVYYRVTDYHVLRRLRALGSKVEVLLPWDLRQEMALESQNTWNLYK